MGGAGLIGGGPVGPDLSSIIAAFARALHRAGVPVTAEHGARLARAVIIAEPVTVQQLYWLARVTLLSAHDQEPAFDAVFARVFGMAAAPLSAGLARAAGSDRSQPPAFEPRTADAPRGSDALAAGVEGAGLGADHGAPEDPAGPRSRASAVERLRERPFSTLTDDEIDLVAEALALSPLTAPLRRGRRARVASHGHRFDLRRTLRAAQRTGGDPVRFVRRARVPKPRRIILLADVSGSMAATSRAYLLLMHRAVRSADAEAFVFATRLNRITRALRTARPDQAYQAALRAAPDWAGGTRIGECLRSFVDDFGQRGPARGAVVVIVSDGWDTGDLTELDRVLARIARLAHRIVWVNPRSAAPGYEPLAGGMRTALPYVDAFVSGHSLAALQDVVAAIGSPDHDRKIHA